jgi:hypothetical protein
LHIEAFYMPISGRKAQRDRTIGFGAVEYGYQTLDKLARHVETATG